MPECGMTSEDHEDEDEASESLTPPLTADSRHRLSYSPSSKSRSLPSIQQTDGQNTQNSAGSQPNSDGVKTVQRPGSNVSDELDGKRSRSQSRMSTAQNVSGVLQKSVSLEKQFCL